MGRGFRVRSFTSELNKSFHDRTSLIDQSNLLVNEPCQSVIICTMNTNFDGVNIYIISEPEKLIFSENSASK